MSEFSKPELFDQLKQHLQDHDGEVVYWGSPIAIQQPKAPAQPVQSKKDALDVLRKDSIGDCQRCPLAATRIKLVFGVGNPESNVMFVGEGPGYDEDRKGEPFVGKAGQLLDKILEAIQLDRSMVYIANIVKCHPMVDSTRPNKRGNDRPPNDEEIETCRPFLFEQIRIIEPKIIVTLGATATKALLMTNDGIMKLRGKVKRLQLDGMANDIAVLPTFHPAALLRNPDWKKPVWEDMKFLRSFLQEKC